VGNIRFIYLYRDGSNYKKWAEVVFSNTDELPCESVRTELKEMFLEDGLFIAHQVRIPEAFLWNEHSVDSDDHCFHEFSDVEVTTDTTNDQYRRTIHTFVNEVSITAMRGWQAFDPSDRVAP
jgi:hypothetical protein